MLLCTIKNNFIGINMDSLLKTGADLLKAGAITTAFASGATAADLPDDWISSTIQNGNTVSVMVLDQTGIDIHSDEGSYRAIEKHNPHLGNLDQVSPGQMLNLPESADGFICEIPTTDLEPDAASIERSLCVLKALLG